MPRSDRFALIAITAACVTTSLPARAQALRQDPQALVAAAESFLLAQVAALPGKPVISVRPPARAASLPACGRITPFLPNGPRLRARLSVGLRCASLASWTVYAQASLSVQGQYYVAARTLNPGDTLRATSLTARSGDLISLPVGAVTNPTAVLGQVTKQRIIAGQIVRTHALRSARSVQRDQTVRILARGTGFQVASEGQTLSAGAPGKSVQVRTASGQIISAIVRDEKTVEIPF